MDLSTRLYLFKIIKRKKKSANTRLADDFHLLYQQFFGAAPTYFLKDLIFMLHLLSGGNWKVILEIIKNGPI